MVEFLKRDNAPDLAYVRAESTDKGENLPTLMFLGGFRSDMEGTKALFLEEKCRSRGQAFIRFDYRGHGISSILIHDIENLCKDYDIKSIRVDTHKENTSMQNLLKKHNFKYCGWIYLLDKSMRNAYEKLVE